MECAVFQLTFCLFEWISSSIPQFFVAELAPMIGLLTKLCFRLKRVVAQLFTNWTNIFNIDSWKEFFGIAVVRLSIILLLFFLLNCLIVLDDCRLGLFFRLFFRRGRFFLLHLFFFLLRRLFNVFLFLFLHFFLFLNFLLKLLLWFKFKIILFRLVLRWFNFDFFLFFAMLCLILSNFHFCFFWNFICDLIEFFESFGLLEFR